MAPTVELLNDLRLINTGSADNYECPPVRIAEDGTNITATNNIRLIIPATVALDWDTTVATVNVFMSGTGVVSTSVTYANTDNTAVIDVTTSFAPGDRVVITGLRFKNPSTQEEGWVVGLAWDGTNTPGASTSNLATVGSGGMGFTAVNHFTYKIGDVTPALPMLTYVDGTGGNVVTAANNIRICIRNTGAFGTAPKWDTTMTSFTAGGTASGKVSTTLSGASFTNNDRTLVIDVTSDFNAGDETLTIAGLRFATPPAGAMYGVDSLEFVADGTDAPPVSSVAAVNSKVFAIGPPTISQAAIPLIALSASAQAIGKVTITDTLGLISADDDIRLVIMNIDNYTNNFSTTAYGRSNLTWDAVTPVYSGSASSKVFAGAITRADSNRMALIKVSSDFVPGDVLTINGLTISNSMATATKLYIGLVRESAVDGDSTAAWGQVSCMTSETNVAPDPPAPGPNTVSGVLGNQLDLHSATAFPNPFDGQPRWSGTAFTIVQNGIEVPVGISGFGASNYRTGLKFVSSTGKVATFAAGAIDVGTVGSRMVKNASFSINLATAGNYLAGADAANHWVAVVTDASGNVKLTTDFPTFSTASGVTDGDLIYRYYSGTLYRYVRWLRTDGSNNVLPFIEVNGAVLWNSFVNVLTTSTTATTFAPLSLAAVCSPSSRLAIIHAKFSSGTDPVYFYIRATGTFGTGLRVAYNSGTNQGIQMHVPTDVNQSIDWSPDQNAHDADDVLIDIHGYGDFL